MKYHAYNPNELFMTVVISNYYQLRVTSISLWVSFSIDENEKISAPAVKDLTLDSKVRFLKKEEEKLRHVSKHSNAIFIYKRETFRISSKSSLKLSRSATDVIQNWRNLFCSFFSLDQWQERLQCYWRWWRRRRKLSRRLRSHIFGLPSSRNFSCRIIRRTRLRVRWWVWL